MEQVYYYRSPEHSFHYVLSFAFAFDLEEEEKYYFAFAFPYSYHRCMRYLTDMSTTHKRMKMISVGKTIVSKRMILIDIYSD